jgi:ATP-dependent Clp protease protease subunit
MTYWPRAIGKDERGRETEFDLISRLYQDRIILLDSEIDDNTASCVIAQLLYLDSVDNESEIVIYINSPGGSISSGMAIYDVMNHIKSPITTVCVGIAASMAAFLLNSGTKGKRYALPNSTVMIHQPLGGAQGQATEMEIAVKRILALRTKLYEIMAKNSDQDVEVMAKACERDNYLTAEEAKEFGLIDEILPAFPKAWNKEEVI